MSRNIPENFRENVPENTLENIVQSSYHSPRCVAAFIKYFRLYYLVQPYDIQGDSLIDALNALLENLIFRRLNDRIFRYTSQQLKVR